MYNVSGLDAVELTLRNGRRFRVGTDERQALLNALNEPESGRRDSDAGVH